MNTEMQPTPNALAPSFQLITRNLQARSYIIYYRLYSERGAYHIFIVYYQFQCIYRKYKMRIFI